MRPLYNSQLKALFTKDWIIRRRHWIVTLFELFLPALLTIVLKKNLPHTSLSGVSFNSIKDDPRPLCEFWGETIYYSPNLPDINHFMKSFQKSCDFSDAKPLYNESSILEKISISTTESSTIPVGVSFYSFNLSEGVVDYSLLLPELQYNDPWSRGSVFQYLGEFIQQASINFAFASYPQYPDELKKLHYTHELLKEEDQSSPNLNIVSKISFFLVYFFLEVNFLLMVSIIIRRIVSEKSTNSKEFLRIMGMSDHVYWISNFINYFTIAIFHALMITAIISFYFDENPFGQWSPSLFAISHLMASASTIVFTFAISTVVNSPIKAVLIAITFRAISGYLPIRAASSKVSFLWIPTKYWSCLLPDGGLYWSLYDLAVKGNSNRSIWKYFFTSFGNIDSIPIGIVFGIVIFSWFMYGFLTWYFDAVWPWQPGIVKPWYFLCRDYCIKNSNQTETIDLEACNSSGLHESITFRSEASVRCINLVKSFGSLGSRKTVVDHLNLDILKGQITVLLGHNGAGKTTTMNMMTGIMSPTSGSVLINGIDISKNVVGARQAIALCPQTNILFEELTVEQNLYLCAGLRGLNEAVKRELVPLNTSRVNLQQKAKSLAKDLSGGMKRRLQLALALTTSSQILILDEPTSGLDPESRRQLWNLLLQMRKKLTILLTTHFMEEADALGDRIVIMDSGRIKCSGSPMFLKNKLGAGYLIRIAKDPKKFNLPETKKLIKSFFHTSNVITDNAEECIFRLDKEESDQIASHHLPDLCDGLDEKKNSLGILTYGINVSTLEDVFLRVSLAENEVNLTGSASPTVNINDSMFNAEQILNYKKLTGCALTFQRFKGLIYKRFHYVKRHKKILIFTFILPIFAFFLTFEFTKSAVDVYDNELSRELAPVTLNSRSIYGDDVVAAIRTKSIDNLSSFAQTYIQTNKEMGIDTEIIDSQLTLSDFLAQKNMDRETFSRRYLFGLLDDKQHHILWHNPDAFFGLPLSIDAYSNAIIRHQPNKSNSRISTTLKAAHSKTIRDPRIKKFIVLALMSIFTPFGLCFIAGSYFLFPSTEFNSKVALIQKMNGVDTLLFWSSHYLFDFGYHFVVSLLSISVICFVDDFFLQHFEFLVTTLGIFMLFGLSTIPCTYILSYLAISPDAGFVLIVVISLITSLIGSALFYLVTILIEEYKSWATYGFFFPPFAATTAIANLYSQVIQLRHCEIVGTCLASSPPNSQCCDNITLAKNSNPLDKDEGVYRQFIALSISSVIYFAALIVFDKSLLQISYWLESCLSLIFKPNVQPTSMDDDDVAIERDRVDALLKKSNYPDLMIVHELTKDFRNFRAVDNLSFSVRQKECFGLLGINGAGKTTTFRMLTGDILVTSGDAFIHKVNLRDDLKNFLKSVSYCPQYDALLDNLTPRETLALFARLRGMPESKVKANIDYMIKSLDLSKFALTLNCNLSGGNKRKLSLAIASIAKPDLLFLDEPTTGVDPLSRRKIWSSLIYLRDHSGSSIVLTSHSMDECEALCSRIGIMARGKLRCLGSSQYLKQKFGQGFSLLIKIEKEAVKSPEKIEEINTFIMENFTSASLRDHYQSILNYHITDASSQWGDMLRKLERAKSKLPIEDYTLTGTTLEQVFLSFAKRSA